MRPGAEGDGLLVVPAVAGDPSQVRPDGAAVGAEPEADLEAPFPGTAAAPVELGYLGVTWGVDLHGRAVSRAAWPFEPLAGSPAARGRPVELEAYVVPEVR